VCRSTATKEKGQAALGRRGGRNRERRVAHREGRTWRYAQEGSEGMRDCEGESTGRIKDGLARK